MMLRRIWLHMRSRIAEVRAERSLRRTARTLAEYGFFCRQKDGYVLALKAINRAERD